MGRRRGSVIFATMHNKWLIVVLVFGASYALNLPAEFKQCKRSDPNLDECLRDAIQESLPILVKGLPEFKFDTIDPVKVPSLTVGEGTGAVHVVQNYRNLEIHNLKTAKVEKVKSVVTDDELKMDVDVYVDSARLEADYSLDGNILVVPINGNGTCTISLKKCKVHFYLEGEFFTKKEKNYVQIKEFVVTMDPAKVEFDFRNLFNGDKNLGDAMNKLLNDNWNDVFGDVKKGYEEALGAIFKGISNLIFKKVPYNEIFLV